MPWTLRGAALGAAAALLLAAQPAGAVVTDVVFILDSSGSLKATDYVVEKAYVDYSITSKLNPDTTSVGLVSFSSTVQKAPIRPLADGGVALLQADLDNLIYQARSTFTVSALDAALSLFTAYGHTEDRRLIFLLTDGPASPSSQDPCGTAAGAATLAGLASAQVTTYLIGLGGYGGQGMECLVDYDPSHVFPVTDRYPDQPWDIINHPPGASAVPEPAGWATMILGFGAAGALVRRRRLTAAA